jgi:hypothetical protein
MEYTPKVRSCALCQSYCNIPSLYVERFQGKEQGGVYVKTKISCQGHDVVEYGILFDGGLGDCWPVLDDRLTNRAVYLPSLNQQLPKLRTSTAV